jgi:hypothetical protein
MRTGFAGRLTIGDAPESPKKTEFTEPFHPLHALSTTASSIPQSICNHVENDRTAP